MEAVQQGLSVLVVLGLLGGTLWWLRRRGMVYWGARAAAGGRSKRLRAIERLPLTPQHSLHVVEVEGRTVLIATSPGGCSILEAGAPMAAEERTTR